MEKKEKSPKMSEESTLTPLTEGTPEPTEKPVLTTPPEETTNPMATDETTEPETKAEGVQSENEAVPVPNENEAVPVLNESEAVPVLNESGKKKKRKKKKRKRIDEYTAENDIKFRGPLSYRHLRMIAWVCLFIGQVGVIMTLVGKADPEVALKNGSIPQVLSVFQDMMMPFFLIATFATLLNGSRNFKSTILIYVGAVVLVYALFILFHDRYLVGVFMSLGETDRAAAMQSGDQMFRTLLGNGYWAFNIFLDLLLCTLFIYFLTYRPKKVFVGKKLIIFRLFALLPFLYEVASYTLKMFTSFGSFTMSPYLYPLLTTKPPMTFLVFIILSFFIKSREHIYIKRGKTHEDYFSFTQTRANSWQFSKFTALTLFLSGLLDIVLYFILLSAVSSKGASAATAEEAVAYTSTVAKAFSASGIGGSAGLIIAAPFVLLFSYTKSYKDTRFDIIFPIVAVFIFAVLYSECAYELITKYAQKIIAALSSLGG